jgi:ABC-type transport system involved in Fe-S cluster assembly fused permease/ATPase subunit
MPHPIMRMRKVKGGFIKTKFNMVPIKSYGTKLFNDAKTKAIAYGKQQAESLANRAISKASDALENLSLGSGARKHLDGVEIEGGKIRKRIKPLKFKH